MQFFENMLFAAYGYDTMSAPGDERVVVRFASVMLVFKPCDCVHKATVVGILRRYGVPQVPL